MHIARMDALARVLSTAHSRRGTLATLLTGGMGLLTATETDAKKHKKPKRGRGAPPSAPTRVSCGETQRLCNGSCIPVTQCCSHIDCAARYACQNGTCTCVNHHDCPPRQRCDFTTGLCAPCRPGGTPPGPGESARVCCGDQLVNLVCRDACPRGNAECPSGRCCVDMDGPSLNYCALTPDESC